MNPIKQTHVIVGMSGGVDSSVTALLLKKQGYHVEGLFMKNWEEDGNDHNCAADQDLIDAQAVCLKLGIRLHTVNFATEYWDRVFSYFLEEYQVGRTPNPDIMCNKEIKFNAFLQHAVELGADYIATGHYGRIRKIEEEHQLIKSYDDNKDQTYFLYTLGQAELAKTLFPIGDLLKPEVREIAAEIQFINARKKDSTGICFIGERNFRKFLSQYLPAQPGNIETVEGKIIGKHQGLMYYTLGQRQGLGIGGQKNAAEQAWYVLQKDMQRNVLVVGQGHNHPLLFSNTLIANQLHWVSGTSPTLPFNCYAKTRYRQKEQACTIELHSKDSVKVIFKEAQRAITPGQSVVFYEEDKCFGGGIII